ncbi:MAG: DUF1304 domain-containing protein [Bdellovibrionota bacterium]
MITNILIALVALLHAYFLLLEMFLWTKPAGRRAFGLSAAEAASTAKLAANQGLYNGFLVGGLVWALIENGSAMHKPLATYFLSCVVLAGVYGAWTVNKKVFFVQALPALIALGCLFSA